jgi:hypothetical protein
LAAQPRTFGQTIFAGVVTGKRLWHFHEHLLLTLETVSRMFSELKELGVS